MSFSRIFNTKPVYCLKYSFLNNNKQNLKFSQNIKYFHSINSLTKSVNIYGKQNKTNDFLFELKRKSIVNQNINHRYLSSVRADTTIDFKPQINDNQIDLSGDVSGDTSALVQNLIDTSNLAITELNLASNWTPIGWVLHLLEALHQALPWYATIAVATLILRTALFPLVIKAQRNATNMNQILPKMQELQQKATNARLAGNHIEFAKYTMDVQKLMKDNGVNPLKNMLVPLAQAPVFISFFLTLRRMARLPVESLKTGGILWFVDLTVCDSYHLLPILTSLSLWATLELGLEAGLNAKTSVFIKTAMRVLPAITLIFIWNFESAILMYWCSTNLISLLQVLLLKQKPIRQFLNLPAPVKHAPDATQKKGFYESIKESMDNSKIYRKLEDRKRIDEINFKKAAIGPIKRTYKTDPTKIPKHN